VAPALAEADARDELLVQAGSPCSPESISGRRMFSSAVSIGSRLKNWKMKPTWSRRNLVSSASLSSSIWVSSM
jgi:hypothetical protein